MAEKEQAEYCNLSNWWNAGYTGKGIAVWNCEGFTTHGKTSRKRILQAAPDATVYSGHISNSTKNGLITNAKVWLEDEDGNSTPISVEEFLQKYNIKVVNASFSPAPFSYPGNKTNAWWKDIIKKYDLCVFCSSGNEYKKDRKFDNSEDGQWFVGAVKTNKDGLPIRAGYSNGGEGLDFVDFTGNWNGTSFSSPYLAGKTALVRQRFPEMDRLEVYNYIKDHCEDLGEKGEDTLNGHGLFILPDVKLNEKENNGMKDSIVTTTQMVVDGEIKEVRRILYNNENFIRLRDYDDVLGICEVDYDDVLNLPIIKKI